MARSRRTILIISQVYVPDPASVGQHMHDAAAELADRGHRVIVYAARRGYADPSQQYRKQETRDGVEIRRLPLSSFGKSSIAIRLLGGLLFVAQVILRGLFISNLKSIVVSTSPPVAPLAAVVLRALRRAAITFWVMDINPDQTIAMGLTDASSMPARAFDWLNRLILRRAERIVTLDPYMARSLQNKTDIQDRLVIAPPWPHESELAPVAHVDNPFREAQGLTDHFVIMYSGNISPSHPLTTILEAARQLQHQRDLLFLFIGGGLGKAEIEQYVQQHQLTNVRTLPYQPMDQLRYSLSAADVHLVSLGENMVGIVHPCKVYGAMAVGRPVLLLGPRESHIGKILEHPEAGPAGIGWQVDHEAVESAVQRIRAIRNTAATTIDEMGQAAKRLIDTRFSKRELCGQFADAVEATLK
jgi:glycosyltransferase involved in cell wall biosynthesis